jgi:hypothetical protein
VPGEPTAERFACAACDLDLPALTDLARRVFMVQLRDFLDPWTFDVKKAMKCCIGVLQDDGRMIPFCTYNTVGYREQTRARLAARRRGRALPLADPVAGPLATPLAAPRVRPAVPEVIG